MVDYIMIYYITRVKVLNTYLLEEYGSKMQDK